MWYLILGHFGIPNNPTHVVFKSSDFDFMNSSKSEFMSKPGFGVSDVCCSDSLDRPGFGPSGYCRSGFDLITRDILEFVDFVILITAGPLII